MSKEYMLEPVAPSTTLVTATTVARELEKMMTVHRQRRESGEEYADSDYEPTPSRSARTSRASSFSSSFNSFSPSDEAPAVASFVRAHEQPAAQRQLQFSRASHGSSSADETDELISPSKRRSSLRATAWRRVRTAVSKAVPKALSPKPKLKV